MSRQGDKTIKMNDMLESVPCDGIVIRNAQLAVKAALEKKRILNQPIARFDLKSRSVYMEYPNGTKVLFGEALRKGRYAERKIKT